MRIFLVGGGTGGPTAPLLAVAEALLQMKPKKTEFFLIGTRKGVEQKFLEDSAIPMHFLSIPAGKWRRYFSLLNFTDIFKTFYGFFKSLLILNRYKPDLVFGAGSYVQVPLAWAAFFRHIPVIIHQQDLQLLLSTKLAAPAAQAITVTFSCTGKGIPESLGLFAKRHKSKIHTTGNPVRKDLLGGSRAGARKIFGLSDREPTVLVMGGGTGAASLNKVILAALPDLTNYVQIIHSTGGKPLGSLPKATPANYHAYEFLGKELKHGYAAADLVICRAGMSTLTELSRLGKAAIVIPLPQSAQEDNARLLALGRGAVVVFEEFLRPDLLVDLVRKILWNGKLQKSLQQNISRLAPADADKQIAKLILQYAK